MFFVRFLVPILIVLVLVLIFTAPLWSKWLSGLRRSAKDSLDRAGDNLGRKKEE